MQREPQFVLGEGKIPCRLAVIGEAPGRTEVVEGRPFVGQSGKLLEYLLALFGLERSDVYITNILKEMPLDDEGKIRRPFPNECARAEEWLRAELAAVNPEIVLLCGSTAYRAITGEWSERVPWGETFKSGFVPAGKPITFVPIWHPSFVLRNGQSNFPQWRQMAEPFNDLANA